MLAYWLGGACSYPFVPVPIPPEPIPVLPPLDVEGLGKRQRGGRRYPIDDTEILEFLELWTVWNDIE
jgi:hypothetical protein